MHQNLQASFGLDGRVAVITGAASGIGRGIAIVLAEAGARTILCDRDAAGLEETKRLIAGLDETQRLAAEASGNAMLYSVDVTQHTEVEALADHVVESAGRLDIWVSAAGILVSGGVGEVAEADYDRQLAVNQKGVYWGCAAAGRVMKRAGRGAIINISSAGAEVPVPGLSIYSMAKSAVNALTRTAAAEFAPHGIRVNAVAPGWVDTQMTAYLYRDNAGAVDPARHEEIIKLRAGQAPLGIVGTPRDMALAVLYLASDASRFMTGQILRPNGGVSMP